jgi:hypothetical protein
MKFATMRRGPTIVINKGSMRPAKQRFVRAVLFRLFRIT